jgi:transposase
MKRDAQHTKNVPGRKTDVQECQWLMKLHTYGLLRDSFRLAQEMEGVRTIWRLRDRHVKEAARAVQHMQKAVAGVGSAPPRPELAALFDGFTE